MKAHRKIAAAILLGLGLTLEMAACKPGPAENVGEKIDQAVQDSKDAARDIKRDIQKNTRK
jgi:hypothetical protein